MIAEHVRVWSIGGQMMLSDVVIAWTPLHWHWLSTAGKIRIDPVSGSDWEAAVWDDGGGDRFDWKSAPWRETRLLVLFHQIVVRDHIDPQIAHEAFLSIDEYRWGIARDVPGAEERPE